MQRGAHPGAPRGPQVARTSTSSSSSTSIPITVGFARFRDTLLADKTLTQEEAIIEIYRRLRPGDPPTLDTATNLFNNLFFNGERYDLSRVGRLKVNHKLDFDGTRNGSSSSLTGHEVRSRLKS